MEQLKEISETDENRVVRIQLVQFLHKLPIMRSIDFLSFRSINIMDTEDR